MFDKDLVLSLLADALGELSKAQATLQEIRRGSDGSVPELRPKRRAVRRALDDCTVRLDEIRTLVGTFEPPEPAPPEPEEPDEPQPDEPGEPDEGGDSTPEPAADPEPAEPDAPPPAEPEPDPRPTREPVPEPLPPPPAEPDPPPSDDLIDLADQHAVSKLMQDSAVHLAVKRTKNFWEIRHRHTPDGKPSAPIRAETIAAAYEIYDREAWRRSDFVPFEPRRLTPDEQQALVDFRAIPRDNARSVRWEKAKTEVDYIDSGGGHAGGNHDEVEFEPGELIGPIEHLKRVLE